MMPIMQWPWSRRSDVEPSNIDLSTPSTELATLFSGGFTDIGDIVVNERTALGLSAIFRAVSLISGSLGMLPLRSLREDPATKVIQRVPSVFDDPDGPDGQTVYEWKETLLVHGILHGRAGAIKAYNQAGSLVRLPLVHPLCWYVELPTVEEVRDPTRYPVGGVWVIVTLNGGTQVKLDGKDFWYVPSISSDGRYGMGLLNTARSSLATSIAG